MVEKIQTDFSVPPTLHIFCVDCNSVFVQLWGTAIPGSDGALGQWRCHRRHRPRRAGGTCAVQCLTTLLAPLNAARTAQRAVPTIRLRRGKGRIIDDAHE